MAVPAERRVKVALTSFSLFLMALFLSAYSARNPSIVGIGSALVQEILRPAQLLYGSAHGTAFHLWDAYIDLIGTKEENQKLHERLKVLEAENSKLLEYESENKRLEGLLGVARQNHLKGLAARVIGHEASNWVEALVVDRGSADAITNGMAVLEGNGVVGQVVAVSSHSARVQLITDHASGVDAIIQGSRARGIIEGAGQNKCRWRYVLDEVEVTVGDRIITSGMDGVYPKGLLIGIVSKAQKGGEGIFQMIEVESAVRFTTIEDVFIVTGEGE